MSGSGGPKKPGDKDSTHNRSSRRLSSTFTSAAAMLFGSKPKPSKDTAGAAPTRSTVTESPQEIITRLEQDLQNRIDKQLSIKAFMRSGADLTQKLLQVLDLKSDLESIQQQVDKGARSQFSQEQRDQINIQLEKQIALLKKGGDPVLDFWIRYGKDVIELQEISVPKVQVDMLPSEKWKTPSAVVAYLTRILFNQEQSTELCREGQALLEAYKKLFDDASINSETDKSTTKRWVAAVRELQDGIGKLKDKESRLDDMEFGSESGSHSPDLR